MGSNLEKLKGLPEADVDRIIEMAWEDRTVTLGFIVMTTLLGFLFSLLGLLLNDGWDATTRLLSIMGLILSSLSMLFTILIFIVILLILGTW